MKKFSLLGIFFLFFQTSSYAQEATDLRYVLVDVPLRNQTLIDLVYDSVATELYYEDEGVETRIHSVLVEPRIGQVAKIGRKAVELEVYTTVKVANYYAGTQRRAPPRITRVADCITQLAKNVDDLWENSKSECEIYPNWD
ncbi:MAG: hypothetical protein R3A80_07495 [Bdellovibrionota bacterium]